MYRERRSRLAGSTVWTRVSTGEPARVLPDGSMDLIVADGGDLFVAGPDTTVQEYVGVPGRRLTGLRFAPGVGPAVLGVPADELRDRRVPLEAIWRPGDVRRLAETLAAADTPGVALESAAEARLRAADPVPPAIGEIVRLLRLGRSVESVAEAVGLSSRQLRRWSIRSFGYGPKTLARILRLTRAVELARRGTPFADVAAWVGYADQAHLAHEARALGGAPLGDLTR